MNNRKDHCDNTTNDEVKNTFHINTQVNKYFHEN